MLNIKRNYNINGCSLILKKMAIVGRTVLFCWQKIKSLFACWAAGIRAEVQPAFLEQLSIKGLAGA